MRSRSLHRLRWGSLVCGLLVVSTPVLGCASGTSGQEIGADLGGTGIARLPPQGSKPIATRAEFYRQSTTMLAWVLELMAARSKARPTFFSNGLWHSPGDCWQCNVI